MAVYGKGRKGRPIPQARALGQVFRSWHRAPIIEPSANHRRFEAIGAVFSHQLRFPIGKWINKRFRKTGKPAVVVEWGCRSGQAIDYLTHQYGDRIQAYGYSIQSHPEWEHNSRVKFIWNDPFKMLRYFKKGSVDLIYSRFGLFQFFPQMHGTRASDPVTANPSLAIDYIHRLGERLRVGGVLVTHVNDGLIGPLSLFNWKAAGFKFRLHGRFNYVNPRTRSANSVPPRITLERVA
ncbi:MAG: hypothetical protein IPJ89_04165 [Candidatus Iainarchaeum archaeon]|uniref:Class I SAM-dependent methyltransferase n=1 Tax=Candidatus Iainarchaeum sp. TaxID=3101447 RepID=A0A7T9DJA9_9ARCH|nr:MAG: hypothetical protein IPJ89_04165 [Candidatus Diapherotrites archaeon]